MAGKATTKAAPSRARKSKKPKKKVHLSKLCSEMNKFTLDAVDREIIKRFKIIIDSSEEDLNRTRLDEILNSPSDVDVGSYHESLQPYIKHYLFMLKRSKKKK